MSVLPTMSALLPLLCWLATTAADGTSGWVTTAPGDSDIRTPHSVPPIRRLIHLASPPSTGLPSCVKDAYIGAYGGVAGAQDHLYYPEMFCLQSMAEYMQAHEDGRAGPGAKTYQPRTEGEEAFVYMDIHESFPSTSQYYWVGPAGVEPELVQGDVWRHEVDVEAYDEENQEDHGSFRIQQQSSDRLLEAQTSSAVKANMIDPMDIEADIIRRRLWDIAHASLPDDMKHMTAFPSITITPISSNSHIIALPGMRQYAGLIDTVLPPHLVPVALPRMSMAEAWQHRGKTFIGETDEEKAWEGKRPSTFAVPVPQARADYLRNITEGLKFDGKLDKVIEEGLDAEQLRRDVRWLTGEAPSGWESRHSFTQGARDAAAWIKEQAESTGANCTLQPFLNGFSPNVICKYPSTSPTSNYTSSDDDIKDKKEEEHVIFSAHYDSRGSFGLTAAPGGDDDGSGSGHLLAIARAIGKMGIKFDKDVTLAWFAGEEQGLLGSRAFAEKLYQANATVLLQVQADMLGYHVPGEPLQLGLPESIALPEASLLLSTLARMYAPELVVGTTAACCSDHQSFLGLGFPSTQVFERNGWIADPMYHNSGDESGREGYDFEQVRSIGKVTMAALLTVGEWST